MSTAAIVVLLVAAAYVALVGAKLRAVARLGKHYRRRRACRGANLKRRATR